MNFHLGGDTFASSDDDSYNKNKNINKNGLLHNETVPSSSYLLHETKDEKEEKEKEDKKEEEDMEATTPSSNSFKDNAAAVDDDDDDDDENDSSYIHSLPEVQAIPEVFRSYMVVATVTDVIPLLDVPTTTTTTASDSVSSSTTTTTKEEDKNTHTTTTTTNKYRNDNTTSSNKNEIMMTTSSDKTSQQQPFSSSSSPSSPPTSLPTTTKEVGMAMMNQHQHQNQQQQQQLLLRRPARSSISIFKVTRDIQLGISFYSNRQGTLQIRNILSNGLLSSSIISDSLSSSSSSSSSSSTSLSCAGIIQPDDYVMTINNVYCARWSPHQAIRQLQTLSGMITLVVTAPPTTTKEIKEDKQDTTYHDHDHHQEPHQQQREEKVVAQQQQLLQKQLVQVESSWIQVTVFKVSRTDRLGIGFIMEHGRLRISSLLSTGILGGAVGGDGGGDGGGGKKKKDIHNNNMCMLSVGDYVISINDIPCMEVHPSTACGIIQMASSRVTIVVSTVSPNTNSTSTTTTTTPTTAMTTQNVLSSRHVVLGGVVSSHDEDDDDNDNDASVVVPVAQAVFTQRRRRTSFITTTTSINNDEEEDNNYNNTTTTTINNPLDDIHPAYYSALLIKPTSNTQLGIQLKEFNGNVFISKILPGSIIATATPFRVGLMILSINNKACHDVPEPPLDPYHKQQQQVEKILTPKQHAYQLLRQAQGEVVIVAQDPRSEVANPNYVSATVTKLDPRAPLGIGFIFFHGSLRIKSILGTGLFASSVLNPDDTVLLLNNIPCRHYTSSEAVAFVRDPSRDIISMIVRTSHSTGVVVSQDQNDGPRWQKKKNDDAKDDDDKYVKDRLAPSSSRSRRTRRRSCGGRLR